MWYQLSGQATGGTSLTYYNDDGLTTKTISPDSVTTYFRHDPAGRQVAVLDELGRGLVTYYDAAGQAVATTDAAARTTYLEYDPVGRMVAATNPRGDTTYPQYDAAGRQAATIVSDINVVYYTHDDVGQLTGETDALGRTTYYGYDGAGRRQWRRDPLGRVTYYDQDGNGEEVFRRYDPWSYVETGLSHGALALPFNAPGFPLTREVVLQGDVYFTYDENGNRHTMQDGTGLLTWTYDMQNRLIQEEGED
jgi:YD repeat-containing protein